MEGDYLKNCILYKVVREANGHVVLREVYNFDKFTIGEALKIKAVLQLTDEEACLIFLTK